MHREPAGHGHHIAIEALVRAPADGYTLTPLRAFSKLELLAKCGPGRSLQRLPHVDDGGVVRGSWRTLMRECLHCRAPRRHHRHEAGAAMWELIMSVVLRAAST